MSPIPCAIVGSAETTVGRSLDQSAIELRLEAAIKAIEDAGLDKRPIDGVVARQPRREPEPNESALMAEPGAHRVTGCEA